MSDSKYKHCYLNVMGLKERVIEYVLEKGTTVEELSMAFFHTDTYLDLFENTSPKMLICLAQYIGASGHLSDEPRPGWREVRVKMSSFASTAKKIAGHYEITADEWCRRKGLPDDLATKA